MTESMMPWNEKNTQVNESHAPARFLRREWKHNKPVRFLLLLELRFSFYGRSTSKSPLPSPCFHFFPRHVRTLHVNGADLPIS